MSGIRSATATIRWIMDRPRARSLADESQSFCESRMAPFDDDLLARLEAVLHLEPLARLALVDVDGDALELHGAAGARRPATKTTLYVAEPKQRAARDGERLLLVDRDLDGRVHLGPEKPVGVVEGAAHLGGARRRVEHAAHPVDLPLEDLVRVGDDRHRRRRADVHARDVHLVDVAEDPDLVDLADREELLRRAAAVLPLHLDAGVDVAQRAPRRRPATAACTSG